MDDTVLPEDQDSALDEDVEGHGLLRNAAVAAALTVGGGAALASPASADTMDATRTGIEAVVDDRLASQVDKTLGGTDGLVAADGYRTAADRTLASQLATLLTAQFDLTVAPENLTALLDGVPTDVKTAGAESVATFLQKTYGGTAELVTELHTALA